jgi:hypothetical protein
METLDISADDLDKAFRESETKSFAGQAAQSDRMIPSFGDIALLREIIEAQS